MASSRPRLGLPLQTGNLPNISEADLASTASPARGKEMRQNLLGKLRPPALVHNWEFWHERQDRNKKDPATTTTAAQPSGTSDSTIPQDDYESRLVKLASVSDVREFWEVFNNLDITSLALRDTIHLFHRGIKPVWEDVRNVRGGSWTFRVPKQESNWAISLEFWKHVALMAIGEKLQAAVASKRITFLDDICGVSLSIRFTSVLVQVWNRDAKHDEGRRRILETVLAELPRELVPKEGTYYYKAHSEHAGFKGENAAATATAPTEMETTASS